MSTNIVPIVHHRATILLGCERALSSGGLGARREWQTVRPLIELCKTVVRRERCKNGLRPRRKQTGGTQGCRHNEQEFGSGCGRPALCYMNRSGYPLVQTVLEAGGPLAAGKTCPSAAF